jgi:three-Cys-motif partner protein
MTQQELFGGSWTKEKLAALQKYLAEYTKIFKKNPAAQYFHTHYIDAFAGTGYMQRPEIASTSFFPEDSEGADEYAKGSAVRALEVEPPFDHYLFIERVPSRAEELQELKSTYPHRAPLIDIKQGDAAVVLEEWCASVNWRENRAVLFLDPFGMEVGWPLLQLVAKTRGIDLWYLFPLFAVNRLLVREQEPPESWARRLTETFGTPQWRDKFYSVTEAYPLLHDVDRTERITKVANVATITEFLIQRLNSIFVAVSKPLVLENSKNCPLYLLLFAAGNEKGAGSGLRIANYILGK